MRQIGTLPTQSQAERFTAFLITQSIPAMAEPEADSWAIWVRDEDHVARAAEALTEFNQSPEAPRYQGVIRAASAVLDEEAKRRAAARKNLMAAGSLRAQAAPLTVTVISLCVVTFLLSGFGGQRNSAPLRTLMFCDMRHRLADNWDETRLADRLIDIRQGQWWRLITPIFLHGDVLHLLFNAIMFHLFARAIEARKRAVTLAVLILVIALTSNLAQALAPGTWGPLAGGPFFLGMSGVVYGLMGYLWMKSVYDPSAGLYVSPATVMFLLGWMTIGLIGVFRDVLPMANMAHLSGLLSGMALGYLSSPGASSYT